MVGVGNRAVADDPLTDRTASRSGERARRYAWFSTRSARCRCPPSCRAARANPVWLASCVSDEGSSAAIEPWSEPASGSWPRSSMTGGSRRRELLDDMAASWASTAVLLEGGAAHRRRFLADGLVDRIALFHGQVAHRRGRHRVADDTDTIGAGFRLVRQDRFGEDHYASLDEVALRCSRGLSRTSPLMADVSPLPKGVRLRVDTNYDPATIDIGASISCGRRLPDGGGPGGGRVECALVRGRGVGRGAAPHHGCRLAGGTRSIWNVR